MADDKSKRGGADRTRVSKMEDYEVKYLAQKHTTTQKAVKEAVDKVGNSRNKVEAELKANNKAASEAKAAAKKSPPAKKSSPAKSAGADRRPAPAGKSPTSDAIGDRAESEG